MVQDRAIVTNYGILIEVSYNLSTGVTFIDLE